MRVTKLLWSVLCAGFLSAACGDAGTEVPVAPPVAAPAVPAPAPEPAKPAAEPTDKVEDPSFELSVAPVGSYGAGKLGTVSIALKPRGEYHVNKEYPISISLQADAALQLPKSELGKGEVAELTDSVVRFDVPLTPQSAGTHKLTAKVKFAVCTPETCVPDERTLALALAVQ